MISPFIEFNYQTCSKCNNMSDHGGLRKNKFICLDCLEMEDEQKSENE